ncbi:hypothetical protein SAMN05880582_101797 [Rhizobium sp. RU20A]|uniref:HlyU family transcriptional regulator n=1 Tax=Rhizobium sp. RU20A TaxID=1907412 RepID=UPI000955D5F4|nr:HlyU family transcriptional regulator [Rhizobium sp. RU20A]SIQ11647.1 hypothetical protein SAMN05880582_101797 [Rhizobium sp. RU20A]
MASFFSKLFGGGKDSAPAATTEQVQTHADCTIRARPMREGAQYRIAGAIEKTIDGVVLTRTFIRADVFASEQDVLEATFRKARQIIDQNGPHLFSDGAPSRQV